MRLVGWLWGGALWNSGHPNRGDGMLSALFAAYLIHPFCGLVVLSLRTEPIPRF